MKKRVFGVKLIALIFLGVLIITNIFGANQALPPSPPSDLQQRVMHLQKLMALSKKKAQATQSQNQVPTQTPATTQAPASTPGQIPTATPAAADQTSLTSPANQAVVPPNSTEQNAVSANASDVEGGNVAVPGAGGADVTGAPATVDETGGVAISGATARGKTNVNQGDMYDQAFSGVINQMLPMSPDQIAKLREVFTETQLAAVTPTGVPPKPTTTSIIVNLSPQAAPPVIRLGAGYISSLVFMDSTGQPWPITAYSIGDPTAFNIQWDKKGNTLLVQSASFFKRSNLAVILKDLNTPVMLTLLAGQGAVDYRVDLRIPGVGPNAILVQNGLPDVANPELLEVLNGVPPRGSKQLKVTGGEAQAWISKEKLFVRTSLDIISPASQAVMTSIDGTHAYLLQASPVILALQKGKEKTITLNVEGIE